MARPVRTRDRVRCPDPSDRRSYPASLTHELSRLKRCDQMRMNKAAETLEWLNDEARKNIFSIQLRGSVEGEWKAKEVLRT